VKKICVLFLTVIFTTALTVYTLTSCKRNDGDYEKTPIHPESTSDKILTVIGSNESDDLRQSDEYVDNELPPEEFIGTIIEEENNYIVVCPNTDEQEYEIAKKIRIDFTSYHKDYLYGTGRQVLITYIPHISVKDGMGYITTDSINTEGFEDFELFTVEDNSNNLTHVINNSDISVHNSDYKLYYYGLGEVFISVDGKTLPLANALRLGKVTLNGILSKCNTLAALGEIEVLDYKDGGSKLYRFEDFSVLKLHTLDGYRDMYIGKKGMDINNVMAAKHFCIEIHNVFGLSITAKNVSESGLTMIFEKQHGGETGRLQFGESYYIEQQVGSHWEAVPYAVDIEKENIVWHQIAYLINDSEPYTEYELDWSYLYGSLTPGTYRIVKEIIDFRETADYDTFETYCYFNISDRCVSD